MMNQLFQSQKRVVNQSSFNYNMSTQVTGASPRNSSSPNIQQLSFQSKQKPVGQGQLKSSVISSKIKKGGTKGEQNKDSVLHPNQTQNFVSEDYQVPMSYGITMKENNPSKNNHKKQIVESKKEPLKKNGSLTKLQKKQATKPGQRYAKDKSESIIQSNQNEVSQQSQSEYGVRGKCGGQEADEFSVICEHIEDEPSIHVRTLDQFQNILSKLWQLSIVEKDKLEEGKRKDCEILVNTRNTSYGKHPIVGPQYETFERGKAPNPASKNSILSYEPILNNNHNNNINNEILKENMLTSYLGDETIEETSAFFNEHNCSTSLLHRCHMVEKYQIPNKVLKTTKAVDPKQLHCNQKINTLIQKLKKDPNQSMNSSKAPANCSNQYKFHNPTDLTYESGFPNLTNEELHVSMSNCNVLGGEESSIQNGTLPNNNTGNNVSTQSQQKQIQGQSELHQLHLLQTIQSLQYVKNLEPPSMSEIEAKGVKLPPSDKKKVLIFDLDETLIHCVDDLEEEQSDVVLDIKFPNGEVVEAGVNVRPYARETLKELSKSFQIVVFTASHKFYADVVLNFLDPTGSLISFRMYRDQCFQTQEGVYIKDLRVIRNRKLKDMVLIDNAVYSFGFQLENGIPIIPFYNNPSDEELLHLINYVQSLLDFEDMREQNGNIFRLRELEGADVADYLDLVLQAQQEQEKQPSVIEEANESQQQSCENQDLEISNASSSINNVNQSSELDQEGIMRLKKKLDFIEISSCGSNQQSLDNKEASTPRLGQVGIMTDNESSLQSELFIQQMIRKKQKGGARKKLAKESQIGDGGGTGSDSTFNKMLKDL